MINLPRDTRFGELGAGLGSLIGGIAKAYADKQTEQGVAQIMNDPTVAETDIPKKIAKQFGTPGLDVWKQLLTTQVLSATIEGKKAEAEKDRAQAGAPAARSKFIEQLMGGQSVAPTAAPTVPNVTSPVAAALAPEASTPAGTSATTAPVAPRATAPVAPSTAAPTAASVAAPAASATTGLGAAISQTIDQLGTAAGVTITAAEKQALIPAVGAALYDKKDHLEPIREFIRVKQTGMKFPSELRSAEAAATTAEAGARAAPAVAGAAGKIAATTAVPKAEAELQTSQQTAAASAPVPATPGAVGDVYSSFTPEQNLAVAQAARTGGAKAAGEMIQSFVTANTAAARSGDTDLRNKVAEVGGKVTTFSRVMDDIETNPKLQGGLFEAVAYPVLARFGYDFGLIPPALYAEGATADQLALQALSGHRGFGGSYLVPFVNATMPTAAKQKLLKAVESNFQAQQFSNELQSLKRAATDRGQNTSQLDAEIDKANKLQERTGTLWWTAGPNSRVFYKGREINADTWVPVAGGAREFAPKDYLKIGRDSVTGAEINTLAREQGQTPEEVLARLRAQSGAR